MLRRDMGLPAAINYDPILVILAPCPLGLQESSGFEAFAPKRLNLDRVKANTLEHIYNLALVGSEYYIGIMGGTKRKINSTGALSCKM